MKNSPCGKFGDCGFSRFGSIVHAEDRHTDGHTHRETDMHECLTPATHFAVS